LKSLKTMKFTTAATVLALTVPALGQVLPSKIFGLSFSPQCQQAVIGVLTNSSLAACLPVMDLLPLITGSSDSIVPVLDNFMSDLCYNYPPCSNETLMMAAQTVIQGCSSDLQSDNIPDQVVSIAFSTYPTVREVLCLKTSEPYTAQSYGGFLGAPAIPITTPPYNSTDGTFCVTSLLTQLSAYYQTNLTVPFLGGIISGANTTALDLTKSINPNIICNECLFGALDVVDLAYPIVGEAPVQAITSFLGVDGSALGNITINGLFNATCAYKDMVVSENGTLPSTISVSIINSTYPYTLTNGNSTFSPMAMAKRFLFGRKVRA